MHSLSSSAIVTEVLVVDPSMTTLGVISARFTVKNSKGSGVSSLTSGILNSEEVMLTPNVTLGGTLP